MSAEEPFAFRRNEDGTLPLDAAVFQALGGASVCWEPMDCTGVFDEATAKEIGIALLKEIDARQVTHAELERRELHAEIDRLAAFLMSINVRIGDESAVDVAIRLISAPQ